MKRDNCRGDLTNVSAKKEPLRLTRAYGALASYGMTHTTWPNDVHTMVLQMNKFLGVRHLSYACLYRTPLIANVLSSARLEWLPNGLKAYRVR